ncbi:MAG TPA: C4-type zinc ribbon domain-containing protein [Terriglobia bacterium]|nr:C4-type zinc ribbon domain-containing protein [Terriglobia bacterium]
MHPDIKTLIELQQVDNDLAALTSRIEATPQQVQALKNQLSDFLRICDERKARLAANQKERRELDAEVQAIRVKITKHRDQLYEVKTNEQYRAMLKEVEGEEANIRKAEDRILEKMVDAEQVEKQIREAATRLEGEKARMESEVSRLEAASKEAERERDALLEQRKTLTPGLSDDVLAHYERLRRGRHGLALVEVRDGLCMGCHVRLRPQAYNEIRTQNIYMTCEACARILYYVPPAEGEPAAVADPDAQAAAQH